MFERVQNKEAAQAEKVGAILASHLLRLPWYCLMVLRLAVLPLKRPCSLSRSYNIEYAT